jgi:hypothetical protein
MRKELRPPAPFLLRGMDSEPADVSRLLHGTRVKNKKRIWDAQMITRHGKWQRTGAWAGTTG